MNTFVYVYIIIRCLNTYHEELVDVDGLLLLVTKHLEKPVLHETKVLSDQTVGKRCDALKGRPRKGELNVFVEGATLLTRYSCTRCFF